MSFIVFTGNVRPVPRNKHLTPLEAVAKGGASSKNFTPLKAVARV